MLYSSECHRTGRASLATSLAAGSRVSSWAGGRLEVGLLGVGLLEGGGGVKGDVGPSMM
jgi:hypothetical protein